MGEMNGRTASDFNEAWAQEQQLNLPMEDNTTRATWVAEFGNGLQQSFRGLPTQNGMGVSPDCEFFFTVYISYPHIPS
jgi:hypothetical protein